MALAERFNDVLAGLPRGWERARIDVSVEEPEDADRAAIVLAPATPGRSGSTFHLHLASGTQRLAATPEMVRRVLQRLDTEGIRARLRLVGHEDAPAVAAAPVVDGADRALAPQWDALVARLPPDWSDLYAELQLDSTDFLERGALLLAPVNPARYGGPVGFRFRAATRQGYGVAAGMARRCLERLDEEGITGRLRALRVLSDTHHAGTQGPVWLVGGRSV
ncbi:MAG TPA: hypothetical protein VE644_11200 [Gaiellaceae bacterium]|nr:hypothetical protein [Gaiellaceae bacterium]